MAMNPEILRGYLGLAELPAPEMEDPGDRSEREALNARNLATATRLHAVARALVKQYAPAAPDEVMCEAVIRIAGYLHSDEPAMHAFRRLAVGKAVTLEPRATGSALRLSGAMALLAPWRVRRAPSGDLHAA